MAPILTMLCAIAGLAAVLAESEPEPAFCKDQLSAGAVCKVTDLNGPGMNNERCCSPGLACARDEGGMSISTQTTFKCQKTSGNPMVGGPCTTQHGCCNDKKTAKEDKEGSNCAENTKMCPRMFFGPNSVCYFKTIGKDAVDNSHCCSKGLHCKHVAGPRISIKKTCQKPPAATTIAGATTVQKVQCLKHHFACKSGDQCVPHSAHCDGAKECKDGSDEHHCTTKPPKPHTCPVGTFKCAKQPDCLDCTPKCMRNTFRCDGAKDCPNGDDEESCTTQPPRTKPARTTTAPAVCADKFAGCVASTCKAGSPILQLCQKTCNTCAKTTRRKSTISASMTTSSSTTSSSSTSASTTSGSTTSSTSYTSTSSTSWSTTSSSSSTSSTTATGSSSSSTTWSSSSSTSSSSSSSSSSSTTWSTTTSSSTTSTEPPIVCSTWARFKANPKAATCVGTWFDGCNTWTFERSGCDMGAFEVQKGSVSRGSRRVCKTQGTPKCMDKAGATTAPPPTTHTHIPRTTHEHTRTHKSTKAPPTLKDCTGCGCKNALKLNHHTCTVGKQMCIKGTACHRFGLQLKHNCSDAGLAKFGHSHYNSVCGADATTAAPKCPVGQVQDAKTGACKACRNLVCPPGSHRVGMCTGVHDKYYCKAGPPRTTHPHTHKTRPGTATTHTHAPHTGHTKRPTTANARTIPADCIEWNDGCNTCLVKNGVVERSTCTERACLVQGEGRCLKTAKVTMATTPVPTTTVADTTLPPTTVTTTTTVATCAPCGQGEWHDPSRCGCNKCQEGTYRASASHYDEQCTVWSRCSTSQFPDKETPPSATRDTVCLTKDKCEADQFELAAKPGANRECKKRTTCEAGTYVTDDGTSRSDRTCASCAAFGHKHAKHFQPEANQKRCMTMTTCGVDEFMSTPGTHSSDRACSPCPDGQVQPQANHHLASCNPTTSTTTTVTETTVTAKPVTTVATPEPEEEIAEEEKEAEETAEAEWVVPSNLDEVAEQTKALEDEQEIYSKEVAKLTRQLKNAKEKKQGERTKKLSADLKVAKQSLKTVDAKFDKLEAAGEALLADLPAQTTKAAGKGAGAGEGAGKSDASKGGKGGTDDDDDSNTTTIIIVVVVGLLVVLALVGVFAAMIKRNGNKAPGAVPYDVQAASVSGAFANQGAGYMDVAATGQPAAFENPAYDEVMFAGSTA